MISTINEAVLHDIAIFKEFFDYDFTDMMDKLEAPAFSMALSYEGNMQESKVYNTRIRDRICTLAVRFREDGTPEEMKATPDLEFYMNTVGKIRPAQGLPHRP